MGICKSSKNKNINSKNLKLVIKKQHLKNELNNKLNNTTNKTSKNIKTYSTSNILFKSNVNINYEFKALNIIKNDNKDLEDEKLILNAINKIQFLKEFDESIKYKLISNMMFCKINANVTLFEEGIYGRYFYIIKLGLCKLLIKNELKVRFNEGDSFGDLALMYDAPRTACVISESELELWILDREKYKNIINEINVKIFEENKNFIKSIPVLCKDKLT